MPKDVRERRNKILQLLLQPFVGEKKIDCEDQKRDYYAKARKELSQAMRKHKPRLVCDSIALV